MEFVLRKVAVVLPLIGMAKIVPAQPPGGFGPGLPPRQYPLVSALDADGDGEISAEEIANAAVALGKNVGFWTMTLRTSGTRNDAGTRVSELPGLGSMPAKALLRGRHIEMRK